MKHPSTLDQMLLLLRKYAFLCGVALSLVVTLACCHAWTAHNLFHPDSFTPANDPSMKFLMEECHIARNTISVSGWIHSDIWPGDGTALINRSIFIDNDMFRHALDHTSLLSFLHTRYMTWSGRIFIEGALAENHPVSPLLASPHPVLCHSTGLCDLVLHPAPRPPVRHGNSAGHGPVPAAAPRGK
ncbi:MAG: hypothetical protein ABF932_02120 [Gluconobacter potus]|uniref:Uncharacterized protein n=1 Tax=Gluconobacter potus TaxID=2724927 RepID=A0ABR9YHQ5_9PROT|nr:MULTISPECIES: hypothetical protein [Gluconobacter]MBF0863858.1 hypothetical protein [Gluconobacter sp. R71656]MBF0866665.1 hypothetical protein [Gluconobacter sp. R75628]MBF0872207.1 hypothetical protein [Gluconobacter sp. R75629]MBF0881173.1 hypothetical protein [Gluconobacter potus]